MNKYKVLVLSLLFDAVGLVSYVIPSVGEFTDIVWAPISAWLMSKLYTGKSGKVAAIVTFVEEVSPFSDVIPTFTLMWVYTYVIKTERTD